MKGLSFPEFYKICHENNYLLVRTKGGSLIGLNGRLARTKEALRRTGENPAPETKVVSYIPCSFMEYISHKTPYV